MENEKKRNKVLEIILIILVSLSLVLIPFLNQYRQKIISSNRTQLVKREVNGDGSAIIGKNVNVLLSTTTSDVYTFYSNVGYSDLDLSDNAYQSLINGGSISGGTDDFGFNCTNYFRFVYNEEYTNAFSTDFTKIYNLVYYIELDSTNSRSINYERLFDGLLTYLGSLSHTYLVANSNYQISSDIFASHSLQRTRFYNIDKDFITPLVDIASSSSYTDGYNDGFQVGLNQVTSSNVSVFTMLKLAANSLQDFLNIEVLPNISLWLLISIPLSISIMLIMFKLLRGDS